MTTLGTEARTPTEVRAPRGAQLLEIVWSDGRSSLYSHRTLRGFCPCAYCQGHQGPIEWVNAVEDLDGDALALTEIREVGSYALGLSFADGHGSGIYTFRYLGELAELYEEPIEVLRERAFNR